MRPLLTSALLTVITLSPLSAAEAPIADLPAAIAHALAQNETSEVSRARVERAQALVDQTRSRLWPQLTPSASVAQSGTGDAPFAEDRTRQVDLQATARWTVFDRATRTSIRSQTSQVGARSLRSLGERRSLAFSVTDAYLTTLAARAQVAAAEHNLAVAQQAERDAEARNQAGIANASSVLRARLTRANAATKLTDQRRSATTAHLTLEYLIHGTLAKDIATASMAVLPEEEAKALSERAGRLREDLAARRLDQQAADLAEQASRQGWWPTLAIEAGAGHNSWLTERGSTPEGLSWTASAIVEMKLIDGGLRSAQAAEHRADAREARLLADQALRDLERSLGTITANLGSRRIALDQARVQLQEAKANAEDAAQRLEVGQATPYELADALSQSFNAESELIAARLELARTSYQLRQEVGLWPLTESERQASTTPLPITK